MAKFNNPTKVITGVNTRWSYVNAWEAKSINGGAPKFSVSLIIPNHMEDLEEARGLVKNGDYEALSMLYDSVPEVLSELIRTAFVARDGYKFVVSDFSAIEARVLS